MIRNDKDLIYRLYLLNLHRINKEHAVGANARESKRKTIVQAKNII